MRRRLIILLALLSVCACRREPAEPQAQAELCIHVNLPFVQDTKAEVLPELADESAVHDLKIWVFRSDNKTLLGYINPDQQIHEQTAWEDRYFIKIDPAVALEAPDVDVYALANTTALDLETLDAGTTPAQLEALSIGGDIFGVKSDGSPACTGVPEGGLPFSAVGKNLPMNGNYPSMTVKTVTLQRMVSKFRLVFSQLSDAQGPVVPFTIHKLSLDGNLLPAREYVFNDSDNPYKISGDYVSGDVLFPIPSQVASNAHPRDYAWREGQSAQSFEEQILEGVQKGELTQQGPYYFRETDKKLSGRISYSIVGGGEKELGFSMSSADFTRNRSWTVYLYFLSTEMEFRVSLIPWEQGLDFEME